MDPSDVAEGQRSGREGEEHRGVEPESTLAEELGKMAHEPLLPVEKRLIVISLTLGILLLGVLWWVSDAFFSGH